MCVTCHQAACWWLLFSPAGTSSLTAAVRRSSTASFLSDVSSKCRQLCGAGAYVHWWVRQVVLQYQSAWGEEGASANKTQLLAVVCMFVPPPQVPAVRHRTCRHRGGRAGAGRPCCWILRGQLPGARRVLLGKQVLLGLRRGMGALQGAGVFPNTGTFYQQGLEGSLISVAAV